MFLKRNIIFLLAFSLLIIFSGCGSDGTGQYDLTGYVTGADGNAGVENVTVKFNGGRAVKTDENGYWFKRGLTGDTIVTAEKIGCTFNTSSQRFSSTNTNVIFRVIGFQDDFSDTESGWDETSLSYTSSQYKSGEFEMFVEGNHPEKGQSLDLACPIPVSTSYQITTKVRVLNSSGCYAIIFNLISWSSPHNFFFINTETGQYEIFDQNMNDLTSGNKWENVAGTTINPSGTTIGIKVDGNQIKEIKINGVVVSTGPIDIASHEESFRYVGLSAWSPDNHDFTALIDDFNLQSDITNPPRMLGSRFSSNYKKPEPRECSK